MSDLDRQIAKAAMKWRASVVARPRDTRLHVRNRRELEALCDDGLKVFRPARDAAPEPERSAGGSVPWWAED